MMASVIDVLNALLWTTRALNVKDPGPPPEPLKRPGDVEKPKMRPSKLGLPIVDLRKGATS